MSDRNLEHKERKQSKWLIAYGLLATAALAFALSKEGQTRVPTPEERALLSTQDAYVSGTAVAMENPAIMQAEMEKIPDSLKLSAVKLSIIKRDGEGVVTGSHCSGTIVENTGRIVILTAAHCLSEDTGSMIEVIVGQPHRGEPDIPVVSSDFDVAVDEKKDIGIVVINKSNFPGVPELPIELNSSWDRSEEGGLFAISFPAAADVGSGFIVDDMSINQDETVLRGTASQIVVMNSLNSPGASGSGVVNGEKLVGIVSRGWINQTWVSIIGNTFRDLLGKIGRK